MFTLRKLVHVVSHRLSDRDLKRYKRLLAQHGGSHLSESDRFRFMLHNLDVVDAPFIEDVVVDPETEEVAEVETATERADRVEGERMLDEAMQ